MGLRRVSEPAVEPVSVEQVKEQCEIQHDTRDDLLRLYISAARAAIENWCHIAVAEGDWELTYDGFPADVIELPKSPLIGVVSVKYDDDGNVEQTVDPSDYIVDLSQSFGRLIAGENGWPSTNGKTNSVRIVFAAGWANVSGADGESIPAPLRQATMLLVAQWFENREPTAAGTVVEIPFAVEALISPYRVPVLV